MSTSTMIWNNKQQHVKGTIMEDIINGFWSIAEDIYYDNRATQYDDEKFVDLTPDPLFILDLS
ncbi:MAG: hypothetical protein EX285_09180 [Thaumarchaeota archaeon]|nr:hypothetical protein [Nitrososphaerota archaeon]